MDMDEQRVRQSHEYAVNVQLRTHRENIRTSWTTCLEKCLEGTDFVISAIEVDRYFYWSQDFHIPRQFGFKQPYGENGGPGGIFHAMRNIPPTIRIAREMEKRCPQGWLLNYTNPEPWLIEAVSRLTKIRSVGLCHGVFMGMAQIAHLLERKVTDLEYSACGMNHFTFFQAIRDKGTGEDLYPLLREREAKIDLLYDWHELGLSRIVFRRFGLWPSPGANHIGEYIGWADEFVASNLQYFYDPANGHPWTGQPIPDFVYHIGQVPTARPMLRPEPKPHSNAIEGELHCSGEVAIPFIEGMACGQVRPLDAVNVANHGYMPGIDQGTVVEVPAVANRGELQIAPLPRLPEPILAMLRTQGSIRKIGVEAYQEQSKHKLLQAVLLEPTITSYRNAVAMVDTLLGLQKGILPTFT